MPAFTSQQYHLHPCTRVDLGNAERALANEYAGARCSRGAGWVGQDGKTYVLPRRGQVEQDNQVTIYLLGRVCRPVLKHAQLFRPYRCDEAKRQPEASAQKSSQCSDTFDLSCQSATVSQA